MLNLNIKVDGIPVVTRSLQRFSDRVTDLAPALDAIANQLVAAEKKQFDSEGHESSGGWKPLSERYGLWKAAHFPGAKILHRTGALEKSLTARPFGVEHITARELEVGTDVSYAQYHQRGTGRMPARPPVALTEETKRRMVKTLQRYSVTGSTVG